MVNARKYQGFFSTAHAVTLPQFIVGGLVGGILLGIGWSFGSILVKGLVKKYAPQHGILVAGDF
jgi:hypothetical protein